MHSAELLKAHCGERFFGKTRRQLNRFAGPETGDTTAAFEQRLVHQAPTHLEGQAALTGTQNRVHLPHCPNLMVDFMIVYIAALVKGFFKIILRFFCIYNVARARQAAEPRELLAVSR